MTRFCEVEGCDRPHSARGLCMAHYVQWKRGKPFTPVRERKLDPNRKRLVAVERQGYSEMLIAQAGRCAICGKPASPDRRLHIDHDHDTGEVRGLLCPRCNVGLGHLGDTLELMQAAVDYLAA